MQNLTEFLRSIRKPSLPWLQNQIFSSGKLCPWDGPLPRTNGYAARYDLFAILGDGIVRQVLTDITKKATLIEIKGPVDVNAMCRRKYPIPFPPSSLKNKIQTFFFTRWHLGFHFVLSDFPSFFRQEKGNNKIKREEILSRFFFICLNVPKGF